MQLRLVSFSLAMIALLAVSGSALAQTFSDVPTTSPYYYAVEQLAARGITSGCGGGNYCPTANITRAQAMIFIERALAISPTPPSYPTFEDVFPADSYYAYVEDAYARGITGGCAAGPPKLFCPSAAVTRAQAATFLERSRGRFTPTPPGTATYSDTPTTHGLFAFVESATAQGYVSACASGQFCPDTSINRGLFAVWLVGAFGW